MDKSGNFMEQKFKKDGKRNDFLDSGGSNEPMIDKDSFADPRFDLD